MKTIKIQLELYSNTVLFLKRTDYRTQWPNKANKQWQVYKVNAFCRLYLKIFELAEHDVFTHEILFCSYRLGGSKHCFLKHEILFKQKKMIKIKYRRSKVVTQNPTLILQK